jgi:TetR/AcrR family transcriptional repressor of nem operon
MRQTGSTADTILDVAQHLIQARGYNGFSFKDLAGALGIRSASVHYHFPTKTDLGVRLVSRYRLSFSAELEQIELATPDPERRIARFCQLFRQTFEVNSQFCLCGMLSAEAGTLPDEVGGEVEGFFRDTETWLAGMLSEARKSGQFAFRGSAVAQARLLLAVLEGAMIVARGLRDKAHYPMMTTDYLRKLRAPALAD